MKRLIIIFFCCFLFGNVQSEDQYFCGGRCLEPAPCYGWVLWYCDDCTGLVQTFTSIHFNLDGSIVFNTHETAPNWVGLNPELLGCDLPEPCAF